MQTANSEDNRWTSEWESTRRIKGNKLFRIDAGKVERLEGKFYLLLIEDNGFSRYVWNFTQEPLREKLARVIRRADKSRNPYRLERTREIFQRETNCADENSCDQTEILKINEFWQI